MIDHSLKQAAIQTLLMLLLLLCFSCVSSQRLKNSITCPDKVFVQIDKSFSKGVMAAQNDKSITVFFLNSFNDHLRGYVNGELKFDGMVITNNISGKSDENFYYRYDNKQSLPILKIEAEDGRCFDIKVIKGYKIIYVFCDQNKAWTVRFSNRYYVDN